MKKPRFINCFISRSMLMLLLLFQSFIVLYAQNATVTGRVVSGDSDSALAGASIKVKGTKTGTVTKEDGSFSIAAPGNGVLQISAVGYVNQEIAINGMT